MKHYSVKIVGKEIKLEKITGKVNIKLEEGNMGGKERKEVIDRIEDEK